MGGFCRPGTQTSTSTQTTGFAPYIEDMIKNQLIRANQLSQQPYQPYTMPRIADFTPDQLAMFSGIRGLQGKGVGAIDDAMKRVEGMADYQPSQVTSRDIESRDFTDEADKYMNPYTEQVLDRVRQRAYRADDIARQGRDARAVQAGAFGGSRQAVAEAEAQRGLQDRLADQEARALERAYTTGANIFKSDADRALQADRFTQAGDITADRANQMAGLQQQQNLLAQQKGIAGLAGAGQNLAANQLGMLGQIGGQQQGLNQAGLDLMYQDYQNQQQFPYQQIGFLSNILQGTPMGQTTTMTGQTPTPSMGQQLAGLGITGLGIYGAGGGFNPGGFAMSNLFPQA